MQRLILPLLFGLVGTGVLVSLGVWQLQRLDWKETLLAEIAGRIDAAPVPLPDAVTPQDRYVPVALEGRVDGAPLRVFGAWRVGGTGHRVIAPVDLGARRVMVDLGVAPQGTEPLPERLAVTGNLDWPDESGGAPPPDGDLWFARDVPAMASALGTAPILVVARDVSPATSAVPVPVGTDGIPNNHLGYAIQWFGLALVWAGMTAFFVWRITRRTL